MKTYLNLLPVQLRRRQLVRRRIWQWPIAWAAGFLMVVGVAGIKYVEVQRAAALVEKMEAEYAPIHQCQIEDAQIQSRLNELGAWDSLMGKLQEMRQAITAIALVSRSVKASDCRTWIQRLSFIQSRDTPEATQSRTASPRKQDQPGRPTITGLITLYGVAKDSTDIARFAAVLRDTQAFDRVELKSSVARPAADNKREQQYVLECAF